MEYPYQTLSYEQSLLRERSRHYLLCYNATCSRKDHCLHWLVGQWASDDTLYATVVNPYRKDVVTGICTDFCSNAKVKMARGMLNFYENIPEGKAKAIRKALIQHFTKTKYFKSATAHSQSPRKIKPISPLSAVPMVGKSLYLSIVTMKSTNYKLVFASLNAEKSHVSQCETASIKGK